MNRFKKVLITLGSFLGIAGVAFATFLITQNISTANTITAESASLSVTGAPVSGSAIPVGGSTSSSALTITNTGTANGDLKIIFSNQIGTNCPHTNLTISGDASGSAGVNSINGIDLGTLVAGRTLNLSQVASLDSLATLGGGCTWTEQATLAGN